jgi:hypothetical protein
MQGQGWQSLALVVPEKDHAWRSEISRAILDAPITLPSSFRIGEIVTETSTRPPQILLGSEGIVDGGDSVLRREILYLGRVHTSEALR